MSEFYQYECKDCELFSLLNGKQGRNQPFCPSCGTDLSAELTTMIVN
jgi:rRNA maturation endonuclease Nob1